MKKLYSIVLMAAALLIGTNAWADATVSTWDALGSALQAGGTVTLSADINVNASNAATWRGIWIGAKGETDNAPEAVLNLNGHNITINSGNYTKSGKIQDQALIPFILTKGSLKIESASPAKIEVVKGQSVVSSSTNVFFVFGGVNSKVNPKSDSPFSYLEIGENVTIQTQNGSVIAIDRLNAGHTAIADLDASVKPDYGMDGTAFGFAYGARVEIKGTLISQGAESTTKEQDSKTKAWAYKNKCYGIKANGNIKTPAVGDTAYAPYIHIHPSALIQSDNRSGSVGDTAIMAGATAVYASGYAQWLIEGTCNGATGVYIGAGKVAINDANVKSAADEYNAAGAGGHANGSGSAIVINSRSGREGETEVTITGDTKAEATSGYAFEEKVNTTNGETKVENITIEGGTFEGGAQGALVVTETTATNAVVEVTGGNVEGNGTIGAENLADYLNNQGGTQTHYTTVEEGGKTILVISTGAAPTGSATVAGATGSVKWIGTAETLSADLTLDELEINESTAQTLTIADGNTLTVGRVVLGANAQIVVEAGAKFIVKGAQGIVAPVAENIVLKNEEGNPSIFIFNPNVTSNRHPKATVEFVSRSYTKSASDYAFQRFGIPTMAGKLTEITTKYNNADVATGFMNYNYAADDWASIGYLNYSGTPLDITKLANPFEYYQMQHNAPNMGTIVTMKGELVGNDIPSVNVRAGVFNGYANSCTALMSMKNVITTSQQAIYLNNIQAHQKVWESYTMLDVLFADKYIYPLQPFLINNDKPATTLSIDYANAVYYTPVGSGESKPAGAPARNRSINEVSTYVKMIVNGENTYDRVLLAEGVDFTAEFDHMYDAVKYMNDDVNLYVSAGEKMSNFATDNLNNTYVGLQTVNGGNYTMEFVDVQGAELTLVDHETGARVAMVEGNTYEFTAAANSVNDYRFEIVESAKLPTAIENTEAVKSAKGVYTITGQYVGEMNVWNTLPAGIYVVNGEKRVK